MKPWMEAGFPLALLIVSAHTAGAQAHKSMREHTRMTPTPITEQQATDLTLTLSPVSVRNVQSWVRMAAVIDKSGKTLTGYLDGPEASLVKAGQRVRAFPPASRSSMYQAFVTRVSPRPGGANVEVTLSATARPGSTNHVLEIVVERGDFLSVPNEAIIEEGNKEEGNKQVVYVQEQPGQYVPRDIETGIQGELYTQVLKGLNDGDQVVTFGSFFIDAEYKLKSTAQVPMDPKTNDHSSH